MYNMKNKIENLIYYMALGDSCGFPYENMNPKIISKINPKLKKTIHIKNNLLLDDMITDDTEHTLFTFLALNQSKDIENEELWKKTFYNDLKKQLKIWFLTLPAGIGKATLISCTKIAIGKKTNTGYYSAGNGPLMRAPIISLFYNDNNERRRQAIDISTNLTHTHPLAFFSSHVLSEICSLSNRFNNLFGEKLLEEIENIIISEMKNYSFSKKDEEICLNVLKSINFMKKEKKETFIKNIFPNGVSGFCINTLTFCISMLYYNDNIEDVIKDAIYAGGDTDTSAGISASVFSLFKNDLSHKNIEAMLSRISDGYFRKLVFSFIGWTKSIYSLKGFFYYFKK